MNAVQLAWIELTRFTSGPLLRRLVPIGLVLLPTLYAAFYLWSNWDPYGRTDQIPVAVVNLDQPVTVAPPSGQTQTVDAGGQLVAQLRDNRRFDWHFVDAEQARQGVRDGTYYYSISVPSNFSAHLTSPLTGQPERATLTFTLNDANNYIVGKLAESAEPVLLEQIHEAVQQAYVNGVLALLPQLKGQLGEAADGADELTEGLDTAAEGAGELSEGIAELETGSGQLVTGLGELAGGADQLSAGADQLATGADELAGGLATLAQGAAEVADGNQQLSAGLDAAIAAVGAHLAEVTQVIPELLHGIAALATAGQGLLDQAQLRADQLPELVDTLCSSPTSPACQQLVDTGRTARDAVTEAGRHHDRLIAHLAEATAHDPHRGESYLTDVSGTLAAGSQLAATAGEQVTHAVEAAHAFHSWLQRHCDDMSQHLCQQTAEESDRLRAWLERVDTHVAPLQVSLGQLAALADQAAVGLPAAVAQVHQVQQDVDRLAAGANQVAGGASQAASSAGELAGGAAQLAQGANQARTGTTQLYAGAVQLFDGLAQAQPGAAALAEGLPELEEGSAELAEGLHAGAAHIPDLDRAARDRLVNFFADPAQIATVNLNDAKVYGRGLAPFFLSIGLWVFGLIAYELLRTVNPRALAGRASAFAAAVGGWLPAAILGTIAATVVYLVIDIGLGLDPKHPVGTVGLLMLGALTFVAIIRLLWLWLGAVGGLLALVLLILQLTSAAGTYPIETAPAIFQWLHPLLPMSYLESGLRVTISGGLASHLVRDVLVLAGFLIAALLLTTAVIARQRAWTIGRLKPAIEL